MGRYSSKNKISKSSGIGKGKGKKAAVPPDQLDFMESLFNAAVSELEAQPTDEQRAAFRAVVNAAESADAQLRLTRDYFDGLIAAQPLAAA